MRSKATSRQTAHEDSAQGAEQQAATGYSPEVEARRADYEKLAEAIAHMAHLETHSARHHKLDIDGPLVPVNDPHLINAIDAHLYALHLHIDWYDRARCASSTRRCDCTGTSWSGSGGQGGRSLSRRPSAMNGLNPTAQAFAIISSWERLTRACFRYHPLGRVSRFEDRWPWFLSNLLLIETRRAAKLLADTLVPACDN